MRYDYTLKLMAKIKNTYKNKCQWECRTTTLIHYCESMNGTILKNILEVSYQVKHTLNSFHYKDKGKHVHPNTCAQILIVDWVLKVKHWEKTQISIKGK